MSEETREDGEAAADNTDANLGKTIYWSGRYCGREIMFM